MITLLISALAVTLMALVVVLFRSGKVVMPGSPKVEVVTDLDAIVGRTIGIVVLGRKHVVKPLDMRQFIQASNAFAALNQMSDQSKGVKTEDELLDAYTEVFSSMCPTIKRKHVEQMNHQQVGALLNTLMAQYAGKVLGDDQKKRLELMPSTHEAAV